MNKPSRRARLALLAVFTILLFAEFPGSWLFDPDEPRYAEIPQHMLDTGDFLTPHLNGSHYFEKPPLLYWLNALSMRAFGRTPYAARLPSRLATFGMALFLYFALRRRSAAAGEWAAVIFLSSLFSTVIGRINLTDALVSFGLTLSLLAARDRLVPDDPPSAGWGPGVFWLGGGIAVLSKGLIGLVLPGLVLVAWALASGRWARVRQLLFSSWLVAFLAAVVPWFYVMSRMHPRFLWIFFIREHFLRFATDEAQRSGSFLFFVPILVLGLVPWTFYFVGVLRRAASDRGALLRKCGDEAYFLLWIAVIFLFFSVSRSKLIPYLFPVFPAASALIGLYLSEVRFRHGLLMWTLGTWAVVVAVLVAAVPGAARSHSLHDLAVKAAASKIPLVVAYRTLPRSFPLILEHPIPIVDHQNELASDNARDPGLFWTPERFWKQWDSGKPMVVLLPKSEWEGFHARAGKPAVAGENRKYLLVIRPGSGAEAGAPSPAPLRLPE